MADDRATADDVEDVSSTAVLGQQTIAQFPPAQRPNACMSILPRLQFESDNDSSHRTHEAQEKPAALKTHHLCRQRWSSRVHDRSSFIPVESRGLLQ